MSNNSEYTEFNGLFFDAKTPDEVKNVITKAFRHNIRIVLDYGDIVTGQSWGDIYDITGYIGRSTGPIKVPLLIHNKRSTGGPSIPTHCVVRILTSAGKKVLYQHPNYKECLN